MLLEAYIHPSAILGKFSLKAQNYEYGGEIPTNNPQPAEDVIRRNLRRNFLSFPQTFLLIKHVRAEGRWK